MTKKYRRNWGRPNGTERERERRSVEKWKETRQKGRYKSADSLHVRVVALLASVIKIEFSEYGRRARRLQVCLALLFSLSLSLVLPLILAVGSFVIYYMFATHGSPGGYCRYTIEICSRDVSGNPRTRATRPFFRARRGFRRFAREERVRELPRRLANARAGVRNGGGERRTKKSERKTRRVDGGSGLIALLFLADSRTDCT